MRQDSLADRLCSAGILAGVFGLRNVPAGSRRYGPGAVTRGIEVNHGR